MSVSEQISTRTTWTFDSSHTLVEFSTKHMMITTVKGRFEHVEGAIVIDLEDPSRSTVEAKIDANSVTTSLDQRDGHLRSADFFDVENHPSLVFVSKRIEGAHAEMGDRFKVVGDLSIRGITREVELDATFEGTGADPWGGERVSFSASTVIDRRDFGLTWNQALEAGGVLVSNQVKISLEVQAVRTEA